jgi:hypothetical protein
MEICHGRFAIICVLGIFAAEMASGRDAFQQFRLSAIGHKVSAGVRSSSPFAGLTGLIVRSLSAERLGWRLLLSLSCLHPLLQLS